MLFESNFASILKFFLLKFYTWLKIVATDCPGADGKFSEIIDKLKTMIDIKANVVQDFTAIRDKFPCLSDVRNLLKSFVCYFCFTQTLKKSVNLE